MDEPINGLDPIGIAEVRSFIRELCDTRGKTILISSHILSEISLLADDIGIIDHGALLEEESLAELEQKSSKHIRFTLSDTAQAARILERNFHETHFSIQDDHNLRLHNMAIFQFFQHHRISETSKNIHISIYILYLAPPLFSKHI